MKLLRVFLDSDLRCGFDGLRLLAEEQKTKLEGSTVVFINRARTSFKMVHNNTYIVYYQNGGKRIPIEALIHLPQQFGGSDFEMKAAIRKTLETRLGVSG